MKQLYQRLESLINSIAMYRLTLYVLRAIIVIAFGLSIAGHLSFTPLDLMLSLSVLISVSYAINRLCAYTFSVTPNRESWTITALILFLIVLPPHDIKGYVSLAMVGFIAIVSKYVLAWRGRHVFNPAAIAVVIAGFVGFGHAGWWVATPSLLPAILIGGGLVVWKIRHVAMVAIFLAVSLLVLTWVAMLGHHDIIQTLQTGLVSFPLVFLGTIMLTEPQTAPTTQRWQYIYAGLVGVLASAGFAWWLSPELALVVGNVVAFSVGAKRHIQLSVQSVRQLAARTYEIILKPASPLRFTPGQYLELSLPHIHSDSHGTRRMFSIASTPQEGIIRLGITHAERISSFKQTMIALQPGTTLSATQVGGDFILDKSERPLVFLAGGIGITPFRALLTQLTEQQSQRPITLLYAARSSEAFVWQDFFAVCTQVLHFTYVPVVSRPAADWQGETGLLRTELLEKYVSNIQAALVYVSGPPAFVHNSKSLARAAGVNMEHVKTDYFSGY